jgi:hypothetical protein
MDEKLRLGTDVQDRQTGFKGRIIAITTYLFDSEVYGVQARCKMENLLDGKLPDTFWFSKERLVEDRDAETVDP